MLELINGSLSILSLQLVTICIMYCVWQSRNLRMRWRDWLMLPVGMALALALALRDAGDLTRYATVWWWRFWFGGRVPMTETQLVLVGTGSFVAGLGMLWLIFVLTHEWFGAKVLVGCTAVVAAYLMVAIALG